MAHATIHLHSVRGNKPSKFELSITKAYDEGGATRISLVRMFEHSATNDTEEYPVTESIATVVGKFRVALDELALQLVPK